MYTYKLTDIIFNNGFNLRPGNLTVIVGPNNAGKSRILKEIALKTTSNRQIPNIIVKEITWTLPKSLQELRDAYDVERYQNENSDWVFRTLKFDLCEEHQNSSSKWPSDFENIFNDSNNINFPYFAQQFGNAVVAFLNTENRLQLIKDSPSHNHDKQTSNLLQLLYNQGSETEKQIRKLVKQVFNCEIALDYSLPQRLLIRVGNDFTSFPTDPRDAKPLMQKQEKLDHQGDGIRSFVGIIVAMLSLKRGLFLIDEPETFLHPPQAFRIGDFLAEQANNNHQIIIATHSVDVLRGILSKTQDVSILRINRTGNTNSITLLDPARLQEIVKDPLLSSARVIDGLFYSGAVVVEADSDARFYHIASKKQKKDFDFHFVNADNKQTVPRIMRMYKDLGVRCAGIVDFDVLNNYGEFEKQLQTLSIDQNQVSQLLAIQEKIAQNVKEPSSDEKLGSVKEQLTKLLESVNNVQANIYSSDQEAKSKKQKFLKQLENRCWELIDSTKNWKQLKQDGRNALPEILKTDFDSLSKICADNGLFINPCGELESMLAEYGIEPTTDKRGWIVRALTLLPNLEVNEKNYPWKFLKELLSYLSYEEIK